MSPKSVEKFNSREEKGYYHSLIALNVHHYLTEQIAIIDPTCDLSFLKSNKIMRQKTPSAISKIKKEKMAKLICV